MVQLAQDALHSLRQDKAAQKHYTDFETRSHKHVAYHQGGFMQLVFFCTGLALGLTAFFVYGRILARNRKRIPREWPLKARPLVNNREKQVWIWLLKVMFDQQVLVKVPVTRFTAPHLQNEATHWYQLLNGLYCTFTICSLDGQVIGCIDVPGPQGLSMGNQALKHKLLTQCGIHYWVVDPDQLPHLLQLRTAFLGEHAARATDNSQLDSRLKDVSDNLHAIVDRQRQRKEVAQLHASMSNQSEFSESRTPGGWDQNSFITPLDSRPAGLRR